MSGLRTLLAQEMDRLAQTFPRDAYGHPDNVRATLERFTEGLEGVSVEVVPFAITRAIRECEYWPSPAALRALCVEEQTKRARETFRRQPDPMVCGLHDCGCRVAYFVPVDKPDVPPRLFPTHDARRQHMVGADWMPNNRSWRRDDDPDTLHELPELSPAFAAMLERMVGR